MERGHCGYVDHGAVVRMAVMRSGGKGIMGALVVSATLWALAVIGGCYLVEIILPLAAK